VLSRVSVLGKQERVEEIARNRQNPDYLPGTTVPPNVCLTSELGDCVEADLIVFVTPSFAWMESRRSLWPDSSSN
jgi:glycerol-3-phosphate dehydrogenase